MNEFLADALKNPQMVIAAGPRPAPHRNSIKKVSGLVRLGAGIMLGVACLMPVQATAAVLQGVQPQRVEQVSTRAAVSAEQSIEALHPAIDIIEEAPAVPEGYHAVVSPEFAAEMVRSGAWESGMPAGIKIQDAPEIAAVQDASAQSESPSDPWLESLIAQNDAAMQKLHRARQAYEKEHEAKMAAIEDFRQALNAAEQQMNPDGAVARAEGADLREQIETGPRKDELGLFAATRAYNYHRQKAGEDLSKASPQQIQEFARVLVSDAYKEIRDGHGLENPSHRLVEICSQARDVAAAASTPDVPHADMVFSSCDSGTMRMASFVRGAGMIAAGVGATILGALGVGSMGMLVLGAGGSSVSMADRRRIRAPGDPGAGPGSGPGGPDPAATGPSTSRPGM